MYDPSPEVLKRLDNDFVHHPPFGGQAERYTRVRSELKEVATILAYHCPPSRELSLAFTKLEEAMFWANAAIARNETAPANAA